MKSLLRFVLMISLVVAGKLTRQDSPVSAGAATARTTWQAPIQHVSLFQFMTPVKRKTNQGGGNRFWQATAPTPVHTASLE